MPGGSTAAAPSGQGRGATDSVQTTVAAAATVADARTTGNTGNTVMDNGVSCAANCEKEIALVCGSDGVNYLSKCLLDLTVCLTQNTSLFIKYEGPCAP